MEVLNLARQILTYHNAEAANNDFSNQEIKLGLVKNELVMAVKQLLSSSHPDLKVKASVGAGDLSKVPFLGMYQDPFAKAAQKGIYTVLTFSADGTRAYLGLSHSGISSDSFTERSKYSSSYRRMIVENKELNAPPEGLISSSNIKAGETNSSTAGKAQASFIVGFDLDSIDSDEQFLQRFNYLQSCLMDPKAAMAIQNQSEFVAIFAKDDFSQLDLARDLRIPATLNPELDLGTVQKILIVFQEESGFSALLGNFLKFDEENLSIAVNNLENINDSDEVSNTLDEIAAYLGTALYPKPVVNYSWKDFISMDSTDSKKEHPELLNALLAFRNVILEGVAGTGKTFSINALNASGVFAETSIVVMHQNYSYEDFVEGLKLKNGSFEVVNGVFTRACITASQNPRKKFLLVIDEINRSNTAKVLGELLNVIEPSKRIPPEEAWEIMDDKEDSVFGGNGIVLGQERDYLGKKYRLKLAMPSNLYILGTMNTTDRTVGTLDLALRRRFVFRRVEPKNVLELRAELTRPEVIDTLDTWDKLNDLLRLEIGRDAQIGHSYFFEAEEAISRLGGQQAVNVWRDLILPQLCEILVTFGAVDVVEKDDFKKLDFNGWSVALDGIGLDRLPHVVKN